MAKMTCPRWLNPEARAEWRRLVKLLEPADRIGPADHGIVACYCATWARMMTLEKLLDSGLTVTTKAGVERPSAAFRMLVQTVPLFVRLSRELGLSPKSRGALRGGRVGSQPKPEQPADSPLTGLVVFPRNKRHAP